ncbi:hypothetical protein HYH03_011431 [Edaphochlamys debaryana]|uniref:PI3K/PI4K catalytic domain-containing protein n=1 Tax=Edaphochlamys debaryana TaxID=47281 RepID=A0A835XUR3_9CHLO|nr:hypothetical protein HYH03_011431 [Edaphochlamys debaryana]|eukprot:KAG2490125.1 hypothetical protein HYH03_011431 [Edaphochlamys debaryana]
MPCLPLPKVKGRPPPGSCDAEAILLVMQHLTALDKLSRECGFTDIVPRVWLAPVRGVVPGIGYPIDWWGLWMEYAEGVSLENFQYRGRPRMLDRETHMEVFNNKLNKTRVLRAAIFDLLTSQCDRHAQNVMLQEDGNFVLIDNDATLNLLHHTCGFDSIFVPNTLKYEAARTANHWVLKLPGADTVPRPPSLDFQILLDYRCALPEGREAMGTSYPPQVEQCLRHIADMTPEQITKGYEWAAKYGLPRNTAPRRYRSKPKCCKLELPNVHATIQCAHPYEPVWELPLGNPITGGVWDKNRPDIGTYEGGTFPEDPPEAGLGGEGSGGFPPAPPPSPRRPGRSPPPAPAPTSATTRRRLRLEW